MPSYNASDTRAVLGAVLTLVSEPHPSEVLRRVVQTACMLVDARYGALAITGSHRTVTGLVRNDGDADVAEKFGGLVGEELNQLLGDKPIRCADVGDYLTPLGFPHDELTIKTFLGVPIRSRRGFSGTIWLAEKRDGQEFTAEDEEIIIAFAAVAGAVIDSTQLSQEARQRELWVALHGEIATAMLAGVDFETVLDLVSRGARELTDADVAAVYLLDDTASSLSVASADGLRSEVLLGMAVPLEATASGDVVRTGEPTILIDRPPAECANEPIVMVAGVTQSMFVPLVSEGRANGSLVVGRLASEHPFTQADYWLFESFASQVSVALDYGRARRELERLALLDDQERIARDLHDTVIQQLFATGMSLQAIAKRMSQPVLAERVLQAVTTLDNTIHDIRATVFALASPADERPTIRTSVLAEVAQFSEPDDVSVRVSFHGPVDTAVGPAVGPHVMATLREALSNVARHAEATHVDVCLEAGSDIVLLVSDDGVGIPHDQTRRSGLRNLAERAQSLGGRMEISTPDRGTVLTWRIPIGAAH